MQVVVIVEMMFFHMSLLLVNDDPQTRGISRKLHMWLMILQYLGSLIVRN